MNEIPEADKSLADRLPFGVHGSAFLPAVNVESYSLIFKENGKFIGDRVNKAAFSSNLDTIRKTSRRRGHDDPFSVPSDEIRKSDLAEILKDGKPAAAEMVNAALDQFADDLFDVLQRYRKTKEWRRVQRIAVGGGFSDDRIGRLAVARVQSRLHAENINCDLRPIDQDPNEAGLIGVAHLAPSWIFANFDAIIAIDIGGTKMRCGALRLKFDKQSRITKVKALHSRIWRHVEDSPNRTQAIDELVSMIDKVIRKCRCEKIRLAPFIGIGCPGRIRPNGMIDRGAQNLPGKWEGDAFNLPAILRDRLVVLKGHETVVLMHNDAVVQGLSQIPVMQDVQHWAILTIGTGLGNAKFTNRDA